MKSAIYFALFFFMIFPLRVVEGRRGFSHNHHPHFDRYGFGLSNSYPLSYYSLKEEQQHQAQGAKSNEEERHGGVDGNDHPTMAVKNVVHTKKTNNAKTHQLHCHPANKVDVDERHNLGVDEWIHLMSHE